MKTNHLSNIELYYSPKEKFAGNEIILDDEEFKHAVQVMRNSVGETIYITNGSGSIFRCKIISINKKKLQAEVIEEIKKKNEFENIFFCIPKLKNPDRLKFAIEKCVELGITKFILFDSERTISKSSKVQRWEKIALAAMKQSLHAYLPEIKLKSLSEISELNGEKILFDQNALEKFTFINQSNTNYYFIFGPEGGLTEKEINLFKGAKKFSLGSYRLRSETAIVKCVSLL